MATVTATIQGVSLAKFPASDDISGSVQRLTALVQCQFAASTAGDIWHIPTLASTVQGIMRDGRTLTLRGGVVCGPGLDAADLAFYAGTLAVSGTGLTCTPANAAGTATATSATVKPVQFLVTLDASLP